MIEQPDVVDVPARGRYEARLAGELVGYAAYRTMPGRLIVVDTVIVTPGRPEADPAHRQAVGDALSAAVLADVRRRRTNLSPLCPALVDYLRRNPQHRDLIDPAYRGAFAEA